MPKYYFAENTNRKIAGQTFEPVDNHAGTVRGVFSTDDPALIEAFKKEPSVTEIDADEYADRLKKKAPSLNDLRHSNQTIPRERMSALKEPVGVVVESGSIDSQKNAAVKTMADALLVTDVEPGESPEPTQTIPKKRR